MTKRLPFPSIRGTSSAWPPSNWDVSFCQSSNLNGNIGSSWLLNLSAFRMELMPSAVLVLRLQTWLEQHHSGSPCCQLQISIITWANFLQQVFIYIYSIGSVSLENSDHYICSLSFLHYTSLSNTLNNSSNMFCSLLFISTCRMKISQRAYSLVQGWHQLGTQ